MQLQNVQSIVHHTKTRYPRFAVFEPVIASQDFEECRGSFFVVEKVAFVESLAFIYKNVGSGF